MARYWRRNPSTRGYDAYPVQDVLTAHVRFGGKADMPFCTQMSAYDPKRTSGLIGI